MLVRPTSPSAPQGPWRWSRPARRAHLRWRRGRGQLGGAGVWGGSLLKIRPVATLSRLSRTLAGRRALEKLAERCATTGSEHGTGLEAAGIGTYSDSSDEVNRCQR